MAHERNTHILRLERVHRLAHARRAARHGGDEPFAFVVTAQEAIELRLVTGLAHGQEQMTLLRLALHYGHGQRIAQVRRNAEFEELTAAIALDVHGEVLSIDPGAITLMPARRDFTHLEPRAHRSEL